jgi:hypothetical protein
MTRCSNCGSELKCGCQKRVASDGKQCCTTCIGPYEASINAPTQNDFVNPPADHNGTAPVIQHVEGTILYNNFSN